MARHRRGRSLSEALTLDQLEEGGVVISSISNPKHSQDLKEGDEIMGATINFDQLSKEEVLKVLKLMEPFEDKIQVHTRNNLSKSLSDLDVCARNPEKMLTDSYSKLYKTKIKKFLKDDLPSDEGSIASGEPTATPASKVKPKHDTELPRLGVDFGLLKPKTPKTDASSDLTDDSNMALPSLSLGFNGGSQSDIEEPRLDLNTPKTFPEGLKAKTFGDPEVDFELKDLDVAVPMVEADLKREDIPTTSVDGPKLNIKGTSPQSKGPKYNFPKLSISGPSLNGPEGQIDLPDVATKQEPSGKLSVKKSKRIKPPDLNLDDPSSFVEFLELKSGDLDLDSPSHGLPNLEFDAKTKDDVKRPKKKAIDLSVPSVGIKSSTKKYKPPKFEMPKFDLPEIPIPDLDGDFKQADLQLTTPDNDITFPDGELNIQGPSGKVRATDVNLDMPSGNLKRPELQGPDWDINAPSGKLNMDMKTPDVDIGSPKGKLKFPKMKMPKFSFPDFKGPEVDAKLDHPDWDVNAPNLKLKGPKADLDADVSAPSWKFKKPNFDFPDMNLKGPKLDGPNLDLKSPDFDVSGPKLKGGIDAPDINLPKVDLKAPKLDLNAPDVNLDMPSGNLKMPELQGPDWDINAPSGKLKMPKMNLSGTLPKGPNLDADLTSPDFHLKAPKIKGGLNGPDVDLPNMDLKSSKLDMKTPDVDIGSPKGKFKFPKMKMPKFNLPNFKGPEVDAKLDHPDWDVNAPNLKLKGPKADLDADVSGPSWKFKKPNFDFPDMNLKGPKLDGPNLDLKSPDFDVSGPKLKGGIDAPDINLPKVDLKAPKLDLNAPDVNLDMPSGNLKMPELQGPDWDINAPSGKLKMPKMNLSGTLPKGPNLDADLTSPEFTGSPRAKLKIPKVGLSSPKGREIDGNVKGFEVPEVDFGSPSWKLKMPDVGFSKPKFDSPDLDLSSPSLDTKIPKSNMKLNSDFETPDSNFRLPKVKGASNSPNMGLPDVDLKAPKMDISTPDIDIGVPDMNPKMPKMKMPKDINGPNISIPNGDVFEPRLKGRGVNMPALDLHGPQIKGPRLDLQEKHPDFQMRGNMGQPSMNFSSPKMTDFRGPKTGINFPPADVRGPQADLELTDRKFKLPSFKMPQYGGTNIHNLGCDIDFGESFIPKTLSPPNATLNMRSGTTKGNLRSPRLTAQNNMVSNMPKAAIRTSQPHHRSSGLDIDNPSAKFQGPSPKMYTNVSMKTPVLDIDQDVRLRPNRRASRSNVRSSYPAANAALYPHMDFRHSDLNIDDFTGKDYVLRARGSNLDLSERHNYGQMIPTPRVHVDSRGSRKPRPMTTNDFTLPGLSHSLHKVPQYGSDGYLVTVFPNQTPNSKMQNLKYNTPKRQNFLPTNLDLDVPYQNNLKGSTFFFSNVV